MSEHEQALSDLVVYQRETIRQLRNKIDRALLSARALMLKSPELPLNGEETKHLPTRMMRELVEELE